MILQNSVFFYSSGSLTAPITADDIKREILKLKDSEDFVLHCAMRIFWRDTCDPAGFSSQLKNTFFRVWRSFLFELDLVTNYLRQSIIPAPLDYSGAIFLSLAIDSTSSSRLDYSSASFLNFLAWGKRYCLAEGLKRYSLI